MAYRNGTYIAFHAEGTSDPTESDIKYYNLMKAWTAKVDDDFSMVNSHEKNASVRDSSLKETLRRRLVERLRNSRNFVLLVGDTTRNDRDWVPFEIEYAIDTCKLPIIVAYTNVEAPISNPAALRAYWPDALAKRIDNGTAFAIHMPFKKAPLSNAINQFDLSYMPKNGTWFYSQEAYRQFGM